MSDIWPTHHFFDGRVIVHGGDCRDVIRSMPDSCIDSVCTDPPYALVSIVKRFGKAGSAPAKGDVYARSSGGFMGKQWDTGETAFSVEFWAEIMRVLKPGGHVVAFSGTRTYHRMAVAIEDAGFEIRDQIGWTFGSGFPKSHNAGNGWGTALKPAWEPICLARKPIIGTVAANVLEHGTGALNIDGCRVENPDYDPDAVQRQTDNTIFQGKGAGHEQPTYNSAGRWPANIIHDGSDEVLAAFPETTSGSGERRPNGGGEFFKGINAQTADFSGDSGSAARFFYTAKADAHDRIASKHPTVKPVDLMQYLVRLVTPKGGTVLDPFAGTGTTGEAAWREGFRAILIERETEYLADIARRMDLAAKPTKRNAVVKAKGNPMGAEGTPLFSEAAE